MQKGWALAAFVLAFPAAVGARSYRNHFRYYSTYRHRRYHGSGATDPMFWKIMFGVAVVGLVLYFWQRSRRS